ncbi:MAG: 16S rRNA (cytosine(967)-C(5))-methyltransferase RsmB [Pseudomonadota bacterium]
MITDTRALAATVLTQVLTHGRSLDWALAQHLPKLPDAGERALAQELCYGVLRWHLRLDALARRLLHKPMQDQILYALLLLGLYQLMYTRIAPHAAVNLTVAAAQALQKPWAKGVINACLRGYQRDAARFIAELDAEDVTATAHPQWLLDALKADWPQQWPDIVRANNERPPLSLRVNARKTTRALYLEELAQAGIHATELPYTTHGVRIEKPVPVEALPGWAAGRVSVQDGAAQQAAPLLDAQPGERVLDACAAPGGKTCHILESQPALGELVALDYDAERVARIRQNLERLELSATLITGDALRPADWWDGRPFDRILLDAPCSATGVIRRHPDIKLLRSAADIEALAARQQRLLTALWPLLKSGGMLLYASCSVLARENEQPLRALLAAHGDARVAPIAFPWRQQESPFVEIPAVRERTAIFQLREQLKNEEKPKLCFGFSCSENSRDGIIQSFQQAEYKKIGQYILPGEQGMDGFYYARLHKTG